MERNLLFKGFLTLLIGVLALSTSTNLCAQTVFINEIHYDNASTDVAEGIEVAGPAGTDLTGWTLILYNGSNGSIYNTINLSGIIADQQAGFGTIFFGLPTNGLQNGGPDGIALGDNNGSLIQFLSYEGSFNGIGGIADGITSTDIGQAESSSTPEGFSLQLGGNGTLYTDFAWEAPATSTYDAVNGNQVFGTPVPSVIINEVDADTPSTDVEEFIELYDGGSGNTALDGLVVVLFNGSNDQSYRAIDLDGFSTDANGYFVIGNSGVANVSIVIPSNGIQNGADAVALYQAEATDFPNGTLPTTTDLLDAIVYDTNDADDAGLLVLLNNGEAQINEDGAGDKDNQSMQRVPNGDGGGRNTSTYAQATPTPGASNDVIQPASIIINEVDADTPSTDVEEFIELYDGGVGNASLNGLVVVLFNGSNDQSYRAIDLDGFSTDANGYFVIGNSGVANVSVTIPSNGIQNGADAIALYQADAADFPNGSALTTSNLVDAFVYDTNDADDTGLLALLNTGEAQVNEDGAGDKDNHSNQRFTNGSGGERNTSTYVQAIPTPGAQNTNVTEIIDLIINEVDADTPSSDVEEFIELFDGGVGNQPLDGFVLVLYNGNGDVSYQAYDLDGQTTNPNGYFVLGNAAVTNVDFVVSNGAIQNGADAVALYLGNASDFPNGTSVTTTNLVDALVYDTNDSDDAGLLVLLNAGQAQINEDELGDKDNHSLQRIPNGGGGARNTSTYTQAAPSPGEENGVIANPDPITIAEARAAAIGTDVKVRGTITASDNLGGPAYIQDATGGIAIFDSQLHGDGLFAIGDSVQVTATRDAFNDQVQLENIVELIDLGVANNPIQPVTIKLESLANFPGQLVRIENVSFPNPGDLLFGGSNFELTDISGPGQLRIDNSVEDVVGLAQPESCTEVIGVVGRFQTNFQLLPRQNSDISCAVPFVPTGDDLNIPRTETFDIATWNIEWFGDEGNSPPAGNPDSDEIQRDSVKTVIEGLDLDVLVVQEITDTVLFRQLVDALPGYDFELSDFVSRPNDGGAKQRVGFIYNTTTVSPVQFRPLLNSIHPLYNGEDASALATYPDPDPSRFYASGRLPFMMIADVTINGVTEQLHMVGLHARANSSSDAQGRYDMRKFDVEVLKDSLDAQFADANVILLGDFNDDVDVTVADITSTISSYQAYINDSTDYNLATLPLSEAGFRTFVSRENVIDHIVISSELNEEFLPTSARVGYEFFDSDYSFTTSDHLPVSIRLQFEDPLTFNESMAEEVISYNPGKRRNGRRIFPWRAQPEKALGQPYENYYYNFVSLGFGGEITLRMSAPVVNLPGNDLQVFESTSGFWKIPCSWYPERAEIFASEDGIEFFSMGEICLNGKVDLEDAGLTTANFIRIVDRSNRRQFRGNADGFDVDAVIAIQEAQSNDLFEYAIQSPRENFALNEEPSAQISVMGNPFEDMLRLRIDVVDEEIEAKLRVMSTNGEIIYDNMLNLTYGENEVTIDLTGKTSGIYLVKMDEIEGQQNHIIKVMKR